MHEVVIASILDCIMNQKNQWYKERVIIEWMKEFFKNEYNLYNNDNEFYDWWKWRNCELICRNECLNDKWKTQYFSFMNIETRESTNEYIFEKENNLVEK